MVSFFVIARSASDVAIVSLRSVIIFFRVSVNEMVYTDS